VDLDEPTASEIQDATRIDDLTDWSTSS